MSTTGLDGKYNIFEVSVGDEIAETLIGVFEIIDDNLKWIDGMEWLRRTLPEGKVDSKVERKLEHLRHSQRIRVMMVPMDDMDDMETLGKSESDLIWNWVLDRKLAKFQPPFKFPGLGVGDDRREIEVVRPSKPKITQLPGKTTQDDDPNRTLKVKSRLFGLGSALNLPAVAELGPELQTKEAARLATSREPVLGGKDIYSHGFTGVTRVNRTFDPRTHGVHGFAAGEEYADPKLTHYHPAATKLHEDMHMMFDRVGQKHGFEGRRLLARNMLEHLKAEDPHAYTELVRYGERYNPISHPLFHEESMAHLMDYLNDAGHRVRFHNNALHSPDKIKEVDGNLKRAYKILARSVSGIDPSWTTDPYLKIWQRRQVAKSEGFAALDLLGHSEYLESVLAAAKFLSGGTVDEQAFRRALVENEEDVEIAALHACHLPVTDSNIRALSAILRIEAMQKTEDVHHQVIAGTAEASVAATQVQAGFSHGLVEPIKLGGKHSQGAKLVKAPEDGTVWLLKPGRGGPGPASGLKQEHASPSRREAAFWHVARAWGLDRYLPEAQLLIVDGTEIAALKMLPFTYQNLARKTRQVPNLPRHVLSRYRDTGVLHKWAVLDWVLGNADRHGQNLMVSDKNDKVVLIDHGSTFAGPAFDPVHDKNTFIPYYLRVWGDPPRLTDEMVGELRRWIELLNADRLEGICQHYGIDPTAVLQRLARIKAEVAEKPADIAVNGLWIDRS